MSFEGYFQRLCTRGHRMDCDVYMEGTDDRCEALIGNGLTFYIPRSNSKNAHHISKITVNMVTSPPNYGQSTNLATTH